MLAYLIDSLVVVIYYVLMLWLLLALDVEPSEQWAIYMLLGLPGFLYYLLLETFMDGKTIGKYFMQIRVVKLDGTKPHFANFFVRWILRIIDISLTSGGIAVFTILIRGKGQRVGDIAAGTTVISEKKRVHIQDTLLREVPEGYLPKFPQVTVFTDTEMQTIKEVYDRAQRNGNHNVIVSLSQRITEVMEVKTEMKPLEFVDRVIMDYNYYTQQM